MSRAVAPLRRSTGAAEPAARERVGGAHVPRVRRDRRGAQGGAEQGGAAGCCSRGSFGYFRVVRPRTPHGSRLSLLSLFSLSSLQVVLLLACRSNEVFLFQVTLSLFPPFLSFSSSPLFFFRFFIHSSRRTLTRDLSKEGSSRTRSSKWNGIAASIE